MGFRLHNLNPIRKTLANRIQNHTISRVLSSQQNPNYTRWHLGQSHHEDHRRQQLGQEAERIFKLGLAADVGLAAANAVAGYLSGSSAIIAVAAHHFSDVVLGGVALWSFKAANVPKDKEHPYYRGHGKLETLGALGVSCMLLATGGGVAWHAFDLWEALLIDHVPGVGMEHPTLALGMTVFSIAVKEGLFWITKRAAKKQGSKLMAAYAWHPYGDSISSLVALAGVGGSILGDKILDPITGFVVSGMFILMAGLEIGRQSVLTLVYGAIPARHLDSIKKRIVKVEGVKGCHRLRGRRAGLFLYLDVHIEVDPFCSVSAAHDIGENVRYEIHMTHPMVSEAFIHIGPSLSQIHPSVDRKETCQKLYHAENKHIDEAVSSIIASKYSEKMVVERITHQLLQGKMLLQIEVSMPPDVLIRDAMEVAKEAEEEILKAATNVIHVSIQLPLGNPIPQLGLGSTRVVNFFMSY